MPKIMFRGHFDLHFRSFDASSPSDNDSRVYGDRRATVDSSVAANEATAAPEHSNSSPDARDKVTANGSHGAGLNDPIASDGGNGGGVFDVLGREGTRSGHGIV